MSLLLLLSSSSSWTSKFESRLEVLGNGMCHLLHAGKTTELDFASLEGWPSSRFRTPLVSGAFQTKWSNGQSPQNIFLFSNVFGFLFFGFRWVYSSIIFKGLSTFSTLSLFSVDEWNEWWIFQPLKSTRNEGIGDFFPGAWKDRHLLLSSKTHLIYVAARLKDSADAKVIWMCIEFLTLFFQPLVKQTTTEMLKKRPQNANKSCFLMYLEDLKSYSPFCVQWQIVHFKRYLSLHPLRTWVMVYLVPNVPL